MLPKRLKQLWLRVGLCIVSLFLFVVVVDRLSAAVVLNELMSSNSGILLDEDGESSDWIELWNSGSEPIDLAGFGLTDRSEDPFRWVFDSYRLDPNEYLIVFASGKDRQIQAREAPSPSPEALDGLSLWLVAEDIAADSQGLSEDGGVLRWTNRTGNSEELVPGNLSGAPRLISGGLNGSSVVRFNGGNEALGLDRIRFDQLANSSEVTLFLVQRTHAPRSSGSTLFFESTSGRRINCHGLWSDGVFYFDFGKVEERGRIALAPPSGFLDQWRLISLVREVGDRGRVFVNGHLLSVGTLSSRLDESETGRLSIGAFGYDGDIAEVIMVKRALGDGTRKQIEDYLVEKYQLSARGSVLHANFKLKSNGETVVLSDPSGVAVDSLAPEAMFSGQSYGRPRDERAEMQYFEHPTPGMANDSLGLAASIDLPILSHESGFHSEPFRLFMRHANPSVVLRYTLDGSDPTRDSLRGDQSIEVERDSVSPVGLSVIPTNPSIHLDVLGEFTMPERRRLDFGWKKPEKSHPKATVIKVRAFAEGALPSAVVSRHFFVGFPADEPSPVPVVALVVDPADLFDESDGFYVPGRTYDPNSWRHQFWGTGNYFLKGRYSERVANVDVFDQMGGHVAAQMGVRIHGGGSRAQPQKSLRLIARKAIGTASIEFASLLMGENRLSTQLTLRNSGQDSVWSPTLLRDSVIQSCAPESVISQAMRAVVVYLNGEYWGIHQLQEHFNEKDIRDRFGFGERAIDLIEVNGKPRAGDGDAFFELRERVESLDTNAIGEIFDRIDVGNLIDHYATQLYFANTDWPGNNIAYWRTRQVSGIEDSNDVGDGRWRWLTFGTEAGLGLGRDVGHDSIGRLLDLSLADGASAPWSTALFRRLVTHTPFRFHFLARFASLMNREFSAARVIEVIHEKQQEIASLIPAHAARWGRPESQSSWADEVRKLETYAMDRPEILRQHLLKAFGFSGMATIDFDVQPVSGGELVLQGLTQGADAIAWKAESGVYFDGIPLSLKAIARSGYRFDKWSGDRAGASPFMFLIPGDGMKLVAEFVPVQLIRDLTISLDGDRVQLDFLVDELSSSDAVIIEQSSDLIQWSEVLPDSLEIADSDGGATPMKARVSIDRDIAVATFYRVLL